MSNQNPWTTLKRTQIYECPWIRVIEDDVIDPAQNEGTYSIVHFKNYAVGILPIDDQGNTWLVGQYRYPIQQYTWEIPEGGGPLDAPILLSAQRELREEAGIEAKDWQLIQEFYISNSATNEKAYIYLAQNLTIAEPDPDEAEDLTLRKLPFKELYQMVLNGEINDSLTVIATYRTQLMRQSGELSF